MVPGPDSIPCKKGSGAPASSHAPKTLPRCCASLVPGLQAATYFSGAILSAVKPPASFAVWHDKDTAGRSLRFYLASQFGADKAPTRETCTYASAFLVCWSFVSARPRPKLLQGLQACPNLQNHVPYAKLERSLRLHAMLQADFALLLPASIPGIVTSCAVMLPVPDPWPWAPVHAFCCHSKGDGTSKGTHGNSGGTTRKGIRMSAAVRIEFEFRAWPC